MDKIFLSTELKDIFNSKDKLMVIKSFAGTGKTQTLVELAKINCDKKILYVAFNKSIENEAINRFPKNVTVSTAHSLAYSLYGRKYKNKLAASISPYTVMKFLQLKRNKLNNLIAIKVVESINGFFNSNYDSIEKFIMEADLLLPFDKSTMVSYVELCWRNMCDLKAQELKVSHDFYLKLLQLNNKKLDYDIIFFDEAQDANPAMLDIILKQQEYNPDLRLIFVGDTNQAIYSFRGTKDVLKNLASLNEYKLTNSFRFGSNIAFAANAILKTLKNESNKLTGLKPNDSIGKIDPNQQYALITRTNSFLFLKACEAVEKNKKIHFIGGFDGYSFNKMREVLKLALGKKEEIKDNSVSQYNSYAEYIEIAESSDDKEMLNIIKVIEKYKSKLDLMIENIKLSNVENIEDADIILTTAHKSKGLDFRQVMLANDFSNFIDKKGNIILKKLKEEEVNILYVAVTRAIQTLQPNLSLSRIVAYFKNNYEPKKPVQEKIKEEKQELIIKKEFSEFEKSIKFDNSNLSFANEQISFSNLF